MKQNEKGLTVEQVANKLGLGIGRTRELIRKESKKDQFVIAKDGLKKIYSPLLLERIGNNYKKIRPAELLVEVPIFDEEVATLLLTKFGNKNVLRDFLKEKLREVYEPTLNRLERLKEKQAAELEQVMKGIVR